VGLRGGRARWGGDWIRGEKDEKRAGDAAAAAAA
jgi:hypothetical protein